MASDTATLPASPFVFGPEFFLTHLRSFVRERCPTPADALPLVQVHLGSGEVLDLCHVVAISDRWVALAVREEARGAAEMRMHTSLTPYELICRVEIRDRAAGASRMGFNLAHEPDVESSCRATPTAPECLLMPATDTTTAAEADPAPGAK